MDITYDQSAESIARHGGLYYRVEFDNSTIYLWAIQFSIHHGGVLVFTRGDGEALTAFTDWRSVNAVSTINLQPVNWDTEVIFDV